jgi:hypothetical protein
MGLAGVAGAGLDAQFERFVLAAASVDGQQPPPESGREGDRLALVAPQQGRAAIALLAEQRADGDVQRLRQPRERVERRVARAPFDRGQARLRQPGPGGQRRQREPAGLSVAADVPSDALCRRRWRNALTLRDRQSG